jgi:transposase
MPLQEVAAYMKVLHEHVAGIDVHKDMIKVAIRSPGAKPWTRRTEILTFGTFYGVLRAMARELRRRGVTHVVMEASGVYTEPVYYALCELDFTEVLVINPAHAKALKGHKTDLLTELPNVSAVQARCAPRQPTTRMSGRSESPGRRGAVVSQIATETGHTRLNRSTAFSSLPIFDISRSGP